MPRLKESRIKNQGEDAPLQMAPIRMTKKEGIKNGDEEVLSSSSASSEEDSGLSAPTASIGVASPVYTKSKDERIFWVKVCDFFITLSLVLIFLGIPLFFMNFTLQGLGFEKQMFFYVILLIGLFAWILKAIIEGHILLKRTPLDIPIALFLLAILISSIMSVNKWTSFIGGWGIPAKSFVSVLSLALFYWFMISNINQKRLRIVIASLVASIALTCLVFLLNIFSINWLGFLGLKMDAGFNTIGLLSNLEIFISGAILIIVGIIGKDTKQRETEHENTRRKWKLAIKNVILYIVLLECLFVILILGSYISLIGLLAGLGVILVLAMSRLVSMDKKTFGISSFLFALVMVYIIIGKPPIRLKSLPSEVGLSRNISWQISKEAFRDRYLLGTGLGNFEYAFNKYKPKTFNTNILWNTRFSEATGFFYESLATLGGLGTAALILLILTFLGICLYLVVNRRELYADLPPACAGRAQAGSDADMTRNIAASGAGEGADILFVALFAASIALGIDMALYLSGGVLIIFAVIIATLVMSVISMSRTHYFKNITLSYKIRPEYALALSFVFVCLSCGMILLFITISKIYLADIYAKDALQAENEEIALAKINRAIVLFPYQYMYYEKLGDLMALVGDKEMQREERDMAKIQSLLINALNSHKKAIMLAPENAFSWENLGILSESIVKYDPTLLNEADIAYEKAIELDPNNPALRMRIGVIKEAKGDLALAQAAPRGNNADLSAQAGSNADETRKNNEEVGKKLYNEAIASFEKAIELKADLTSAYDGASRTQEKLGDLSKAIEYMTASFTLNANNAFYSFNLGRLYYNRAVIGGENAQRGLDADNDADITQNEKEGEPDLATSTQEIKGEEGEEGTESQKSKVESQKLSEETAKGGESAENDLKIAEALFKRAVQISAKYVDALYSLGMLYERQGMRADAKKYYQATLDALPENSESRKAVEEKLR
ncbi:MAG: hypothetical protein V1770_03645 [bacterium]